MVDHIPNLRDIAIFRFWRFGLKLNIRAHFWGVLETYFPQITSLTVLTTKMTVLAPKTNRLANTSVSLYAA